MKASALASLGQGAVRIHTSSTAPKPAQAVSSGPDMARIKALPRRRDWAADDLAAIERDLRRPGGTMHLRPIQAAALLDAQAERGLFAPICVGGGKTLLFWLLPTALNTPYSVILTDAKLVTQALIMAQEYQQHWYLMREVRWLSYGVLSSPTQCEILDKLDPKMIGIDECQRLASADSARTKRFRRFLKAHPDTIVCAASGSVTARDPKDYAHLLHQSLGERTPLPIEYPALAEWSSALAVGERPMPPGALLELLTPEHAAAFLHTSDPAALERGMRYLQGAFHRQLPAGVESPEGEELRTLAREIVRRRLVETPGVVASTTNEVLLEDGSAVALEIQIIPTPQSAPIHEALAGVDTAWERPDGELLTTALEVGRVVHQARLGGYYRWVWSASIPVADREDWLRHRAAHRKELRDFLRYKSRASLDSPKLVESAIARALEGEKIEGLRPNDFPSWPGWVPVRDALRARLGGQTPPTEWVWLDMAVVDGAVDRARAMVAGGRIPIVWSGTRAVGLELAKRLDAPYYGGGDEAAIAIMAETGERAVVASIKAHGTGRNLQMFSNALVVGGAPNPTSWEQCLGRLHRSGQNASIVCFYVYDAFEPELRAAQGGARYVQDSVGNQQKLLSAVIKQGNK